MIDNFFKDKEEYKHVEYMILKSNICKTMKDINDVLKEDLKNKNITEQNKNKNKNNYLKENNKKEDTNKSNKNKQNFKNYTYNLLLRILLFNTLKIKNIFKVKKNLKKLKIC
jgi:hypothetical protein